MMHVVGARPNFMKVAPAMRVMAEYPGRFSQVLVHTGQHYDFTMSRVFFQDLDLPEPDFYLQAGSGTHAEQTARVMLAFEPVVEEVGPDLVLVVGDVNSTLACALVSAKLGVSVAHVEAGLRSFDNLHARGDKPPAHRSDRHPALHPFPRCRPELAARGHPAGTNSFR